MSSALQLWALVRCELQLRSRRASTLVVLLGVLAITWLMLADPAGGYALIVVDQQRLRYSSETLAFGSASLGAVLFSLAGFYLSRGRTQEDLRIGMAGVLAASPLSSRTLLFGRWLGALCYLLLLGLALLLGTLALHALRGEGPIHLGVYLQTYALMLLPPLLAAAAFALLADAWSPLMGRRGDVAYFFFWVCLLALLPLHEPKPGAPLTPLLLFDLSGLASAITQLATLLGTSSISIGGSDFKAELGLRDFPVGMWTAELTALRLSSGVLALPPLLLAFAVFHRYAPERMRASGREGKRSRLSGLVQRLLSPLTRPAARLLPLAARLPLPAVAATAAELLLSLITQPVALLWLGLAWTGAAVAAPDERWAWQAGIALGWGLWAAELGARDAQCSTASLGASLPGGAVLRQRSRWAAAFALGLLALLPLALPRGAAAVLACVTGLAMLAALASLLGRLTQGSRAFLALFMVWMLMAVQVRHEAWLDLLGFNGQAQAMQTVVALLAAVLLLGADGERRR